MSSSSTWKVSPCFSPIVSEREVQFGDVRVERVEVDGDEHHVRAVGGHLAVEQDVVVVRRVEAQVVELVQRRVVAADAR